MITVILIIAAIGVLFISAFVIQTVEDTRRKKDVYERMQLADEVRAQVVAQIEKPVEKSIDKSFERTSYPSPKEEKAFEKVYHQSVEEFRSSYRDYFTKTRKTIKTNQKKTYYGKKHIECKYCESWNIIEESVGVCRCKSCGAGLRL